MTDQLTIRSELKDGIPVLEIDYPTSQMFKSRSDDLLAEQLVEEYRSVHKNIPKGSAPRVCILNIKAQSAGSPMVRAIFELYNVVSADSGTLFCAGYPVAYMGSLTSLGLPALPGFRLTTTFDEALQQARTKAS